MTGTDLSERLPWLSAPGVAVTGLQWGDEGKGKIVDWLAGAFDMVARYNGGANAGHSVEAEGRRLALHLVPCGILHPHVVNVIGNGCVVDPEMLVREIADLDAAGLSLEGRLLLSDRAHLVLPHHRRADALHEAAAARSAGEERRIGTTGRGIGPAYADKALRSTALRVADLGRPAELPARVEHIAAVANATLAALADYAGKPWQPVDRELLMTSCRRWADALAPYVADTGGALRQALSEERRVLFEGANATMLDLDHGTFPFVTSSQTTALGIHPGLGVPRDGVGEVVGIVKAYATRVGAGPFPTELHDATAERLRERGKEYGTTTGRPRRCGWLDLVALRYAAELSGATRLAVMLLDVLSGFDELLVCVAYRHEGRTLERFPAHAATLAEVEPVYRTLPGFAQELDDLRDPAGLPAAARSYLDLIENAVGVPVSVASVGPDRAQTLVLDQG